MSGRQYNRPLVREAMADGQPGYLAGVAPDGVVVAPASLKPLAENGVPVPGGLELRLPRLLPDRRSRRSRWSARSEARTNDLDLRGPSATVRPSPRSTISDLPRHYADQSRKPHSLALATASS
jgi:hypothetical protein